MEETDINKISGVINQIDEMINVHINSIQTLLSNSDLGKICKDYEENKSEILDIGFNIFKIVSDIYYHEKFHSQIIAALLNLEEKHNEGNKFLYLFLKYLNNKHNTKISITDYQNAEVTGTKTIGEKQFIDIWIHDKSSKKCIIIENKINDAKDQPLQIPTYFNDAKGEGYCIDAIIYLSLDGKKTNTDKNNWEKLDKSNKSEIEKKLLEIAAFNNEDGEEKDLYHGWIIPCTNSANNIDALLILRQYGKLIKSLNKTTMCNQIMEKFYEAIMKENEKFHTALCLVNMVNEFTLYLAERIKKKFITDHTPFNNIRADQNSTTFEWFTLNNVKFKIVVSCEKGKNDIIYRLRFWEEKFGENGTKNLYKIINHLKYTDFSINPNDQNELEKRFIFPDDEQKLYDFIMKFKQDLSGIPSNFLE